MLNILDLIFASVAGTTVISILLTIIIATDRNAQDKRISQLEVLNLRLTDELNKMQHLLDARIRELKEYKTSVDEFQ